MVPFDKIWYSIENIYKRHGLSFSLAKKLHEYDDDLFNTIIEEKDKLIVDTLDEIMHLEEDMNNINQEVDFLYRYKTENSIQNKLMNQTQVRQLYKVCNDIIGFRFIIRTDSDGLLEIANNFAESCPSDNIDCHIHDQRSGKSNDDGYKGIHVNIRMKHNFAFPIEVQFWTRPDALLNDYLHDNIYKTQDDEFLTDYAVSLRQWLENVPSAPGDIGTKSYVDYLYEKAYSIDFGYEF
ncbi:hypothetical protein [Robertmurraya andreesenii]|uniref:PpGpp synthetase/RelA/SpoT-type nucleotidyltransferase n=1 Tax=Anoxybacillus andreesenii TaxID=1325932 RepID=A0ABT9UZM4_9BACL|nr:hypothetical protein [Robertmurraya andreesenii]MDQ0154145.1 ppGpp synthetase/RelA/SpoT-type nucleotidyltransferase [Robertmurraya andreesenii]